MRIFGSTITVVGSFKSVAIVENIQNRGGAALAELSNSTNYVLVGDSLSDSENAIINEAKQLAIPCINLDSYEEQMAGEQYLKLDSHNLVVESRGRFEPPLDLNTPIDAQIDPLFGILPVTGRPLIINNVQLNEGIYMNIHVFRDERFQWVIFFDNTKAGLKLQAEQQLRMSDNLDKESRELCNH